MGYFTEDDLVLHSKVSPCDLLGTIQARRPGVSIIPHRLEGRTRPGLMVDLKNRWVPDFLLPNDTGSALGDGSLSCYMPIHKQEFPQLYMREQVEPIQYFMQLSPSTPNVVFSVTTRWNGRGGCYGLNCDACLADHDATHYFEPA